MRACLVGVLAWVVASASLAGEVRVFRKSEWVGAVVSGLELPKAELQKAFRSGFTSTIVLGARIKGPATEIARKSYVFSVYYDLWDEVFRSSFGSPPQTKESRVFQTVDAVLERLREFELDEVGPAATLDSSARYTVEVAVLLDPIQKDRVELIRSWISENNVNTGIAAARARQTPAQGEWLRSMNRLFGAIFSGYLSESLASRKWQANVESGAFRSGDLMRVE